MFTEVFFSNWDFGGPKKDNATASKPILHANPINLVEK
jgi:hypothetical protein